MDDPIRSPLEQCWDRVSPAVKEHSAPFLSGLLAGLLAHGYAFSNMAINADAVSGLFGKGATVGSGRWALPMTSLLFPDVTTPWLYGILSLLMLACAACLILQLLQIRSPLLRLLLPAAILCFPAQTSTFCYMFTSPSYALSFLLSVVAVLLSQRERWGAQIAALAVLVMSLGIFQGYVAVTASLYLIVMIRALLRGESAKSVFLYGLRRVGLLFVALLLYYALALLFLKIYGWHFEPYGVERERSILFRVALAYGAFLHIFTKGYFGFVRPGLSTILHLGCGLAVICVLLLFLLRERDWKRLCLLLVCLGLFPLSINCLYLIAEVSIIGSHVLFGFVSVYILAVVVMEEAGKQGRLLRDGLALVLALVTAGNIFFANKIYLRMALDYEHAFALYSGVAAQIRETEGYDGSQPLAFLGRTQAALYAPEELDQERLDGPSQDLVNSYTRELFLQRYVGFDVPMASQDACRALSQDPIVQDMPSYPAQGCVQLVGDYLVIKLG